MNTISKISILDILKTLDEALALSREPDARYRAITPTYESSVTWRIRMARDQLLRAAIGEVEVEAAQ